MLLCILGEDIHQLGQIAGNNPPRHRPIDLAIPVGNKVPETSYGVPVLIWIWTHDVLGKMRGILSYTVDRTHDRIVSKFAVFRPIIAK